MAHYIFNVLRGDGAGFLHSCVWGVDADERHRDALAPGDRVLLYLGAPKRTFIGRAELASAVRDGGVLLAHVEEWDPPVPMSSVLSRLPVGSAKADFHAGVVRITAEEYETALTVASERLS
jgi:hypothetical protein